MRISDWSSDVCSSDLVRKEPDKKDVAELKCSCGYLLAPYMRQCPGCGKERVRLSLVETVPGEMVEVNPDSLLPAYLRNREHVWDQLCSYALQKKSDATEDRKSTRLNSSH